jgi:hypothetical protein
MTRRPHLTATDLEDLLDGRYTAVDPALAHVLGVARAPGTATELTGLHAALAVFDTRALPPVSPAAVRRRRPTLGAVVSRWPAQILAGLAVSTAVAGVSLAAVTGTLPGIRPTPSPTVPSTSVHTPASPGTPTQGSDLPTTRPGQTPTAAGTGPTTASEPTAAISPDTPGQATAGSTPQPEPSAHPDTPPGRPDQPTGGPRAPGAAPDPTRPPHAQPTNPAAAPATPPSPPSPPSPARPTAAPPAPSHPGGR